MKENKDSQNQKQEAWAVAPQDSPRGSRAFQCSQRHYNGPNRRSPNVKWQKDKQTGPSIQQEEKEKINDTQNDSQKHSSEGRSQTQNTDHVLYGFVHVKS